MDAYIFCVVSETNAVITITSDDAPPPSCTDPTSLVEYVTTLQGVSGSVGGVPFTNQTFTLSAVGNIGNVFQGFAYGSNYHKINLSTVTLTITGTSISGGATVDGGMQLNTNDFGGGEGGLFWQAPVAAPYETYPNYDLVGMVIRSVGTTNPVQADRLTKCWTANLSASGSPNYGYVSGQWNEDTEAERPPTKVNGGTVVVITNAGTNLNGSTLVRAYTAP
jgi:hypothetical protein